MLLTDWTRKKYLVYLLFYVSVENCVCLFEGVVGLSFASIFRVFFKTFDFLKSKMRICDITV